MRFKNKEDGTQRTWKVMVRFTPGHKQVLEQYVSDLNMTLPDKDAKFTISSFIRTLVWKTVRPPGDKTAG